MTYQFIQDAYQARRGGSSRVLDVCCEGCAKHVTFRAQARCGACMSTVLSICLQPVMSYAARNASVSLVFSSRMPRKIAWLIGFLSMR